MLHAATGNEFEPAMVSSAALSTAITGTVSGYSVSIDRHDAPGDLIAADSTTWLVAHGNSSSPTTGYIDELASAIHLATGGDQVLTLDWSQIAALYIGTTENNIIPVAQWASTALADYGFASGNLNLVGHSFGAYVAAETAERIAGGVNSLVGLDPAADFPFGYNPNSSGQIDFAANSAFSWTFSDAGGSFGSSTTPASAHEAITVLNSGHSEVVTVFSNLLNEVGSPQVYDHFQLSRLTGATPGPWQLNQYSNGGSLTGSGSYEAVISADASGLVAQTIDFVPLVVTPTVTVLNPNGGENWQVGSSRNIQWGTTNDGGVVDVDIQYSTTGPGGPFTTIAAGEANDGLYTWLVPDTASTDAYVRVVANIDDGSTIADESDNPFTITAPDTEPPAVTLLSPTGGEDWPVGSTQNITWSATDNVDVAAIQLAYSADGGSTYTVLASGEANDGSYSWSIPNDVTDNALVRVIASDDAGNTAQAVSASVFSISSTPLEVKDYAVSDVAISGQVIGSVDDTRSLNGSSQQIREESYANGRSRLEHKWLFDVTGGSEVTFNIQGYETIGDNDDFIFAYSTDDATYIDLLTISSTSQLYSAALPAGTSGQIYVRVTDTNRNRRNNSSLDSLFIDEMYFRSSSGPVTPVTDLAIASISAPTTATAAEIVPVDVTLQNVGNQVVSSGVNVTLISDNATPTDPADDVSIGTQSLTSELLENESAVVSFAWDTSNLPTGTYTLRASHDFSDDETTNDSSATSVVVTDSPPAGEIIIDDGDGGFTSTGWSSKSNADAFDGDYEFDRPGDGSSVASWSFSGLASTTYDIFATWVSHPKRHASNATYGIYDGSVAPANLLANSVKDQRVPVNGWELLGSHAITGSNLTVTLSNLADGLVIADAIRIVASGGSLAQQSIAVLASDTGDRLAMDDGETGTSGEELVLEVSPAIEAGVKVKTPQVPSTYLKPQWQPVSSSVGTSSKSDFWSDYEPELLEDSLLLFLTNSLYGT